MRCQRPPRMELGAHYVHGLNDGAFKFLIIQGVGVYDNMTADGEAGA